MNKSVCLMVIIAIASVSCQLIDEQSSCQIALKNFFENAQKIIPQGLTSISGCADIDNYVIAYCQTLTEEQLAEVVVSVVSAETDNCKDAVEKYLEASQMRKLNMDCIRYTLNDWKARHPIEGIIRNGNSLGRLLKMTPEGWQLYQKGIFKRFFDVAQECEH